MIKTSEDKQNVFAGKGLISLKEAASYIGYHPMHLYKNYHKPGWPPYIRFKTRIFYSPTDLKKWIDKLERFKPSRLLGK